MPTVKQSFLWMFLTSALIAGVGCSHSQLARFAPPGLIKYENIAGDKPPNPEIQARIKERRTDNDIKYPIIARTPGPKDRPAAESKKNRDEAAQALIKARDALENSVASDRATAQADETELDEITTKGQALSEAAERDAKAAKKPQQEKTP